MMITMLAAAMTLAMLIATFVALHDEMERARLDDKHIDRFGPRHR